MKYLLIMLSDIWIYSTLSEVLVSCPFRPPSKFELFNEFPSKSPIAATSCPPRCFCYVNSGVVVVCHDLNLTSIPSDLPNNTNLLDLRGNLIENITSEQLKHLSNLKVLLLSYNILKGFQYGCFDSLWNLNILHLDNNCLRMDYDTFQPGIFRNLSELSELNIRNNLPTNTLDVLAKTFGNLLGLQTLTIDNLLGVRSQFGPGYNKLKHLKTVNMSLSDGWSPIYETALTSYTFTNIAVVQNLILFHCNIRNITDNTFKHLHSLSMLDMRQNYIYSDFVISAVMNAKSIVLKKFFLSNNKDWRKNIYFDLSSVEFLFFSEIEVLKLDDLGIMGMDTLDEKKNYSGQLQYLSITNNKLDYERYLLDLRYMYNLIELDASYQSPTKSIERKRRTLRELSTPQTGCASWEITVPPSLKRLHLKQSHLTGCIPKINLNNSQLTYVDMSENELSEWHGPVSGLDYLTYLNLSRNRCHLVSNHFFSLMWNLEILIIGTNNLGYILDSNENDNMFSCLRNLRHLDISENNIYTIPARLFRSNLLLERLDIQFNFIKSMDYQFSGLHFLEFINFSTNHMMTISEGVRYAIKSVTHIRGVTLDVSKNNLQCLCPQKNMFEWWKTTLIRIIVDKSDMCDLPNGTDVFVNNTLEIQAFLQHHCTNFVYLIIGTSSCIAIAIGIIIVATIRRYRWKLRYLYHMARMRHGGYSEPGGGEEIAYLYDAFISYADEQLKFVKDHVLVNLETMSGLSLCIHDKDFVPGQSIASNITNAVHNSRKTVILLTKDFLKSYWCIYELNIALAESAYTDRDTIIFVKLEHIPDSEIPLEILYQFNCFTYLRYPERDDDLPGFWTTLKRAIDPN